MRYDSSEKKGDGQYILFILERIDFPFEMKVSKTGKIIDILNWEYDYITCVESILDQTRIKKSDKDSILNHFSNELAVSYYKNIAIGILSEYFGFYNLEIPKDSSNAELIQIRNPLTMISTDARKTFRTKSYEKGIYEIEEIINFDDEILSNQEDEFNDFFEKENTLDESIPEFYIDKYGLFYWNSNTSWIDSSQYLVNFTNDSIELMNIKVITTYK